MNERIFDIKKVARYIALSLLTKQMTKEGKKEEAESAKAQVAMLKADAKALEEIMEKAQNDMRYLGF